jgi:hypothetical protein
MRPVRSQNFGHDLKHKGVSSFSNPGRRSMNGRCTEVPVGQGGVMHSGVPWAAMDSPEFRSGHYGERRLGFTSSKRSGGQGDPYPGVLDGGLGS